MYFEGLKQGCDFGFHHYANHPLTKAQTTSYMKSLNICKSYFDKNIIDNIDEADYGSIEQTRNIKYLSSWNDKVGLNQYLDTPMHLLFQDICNCIMFLSFSYFAKCKVRSKFIK